MCSTIGPTISSQWSLSGVIRWGGTAIFLNSNGTDDSDSESLGKIGSISIYTVIDGL